MDHRNSAVFDALCPVSNFVVDGLVWAYSMRVTIQQSANAHMDDTGLKAKISLNLTGPYKVLAVGLFPSADNPDSSPLGNTLLHLSVPS